MSDAEMRADNPMLYENHRLAANQYNKERYWNDKEYREKMKLKQRERYHRMHPNARFYDKQE